MKFLVVLALVVVAVAIPVSPSTGDKDAAIITQTNTNIGVEEYVVAYETSNGISAEEKGSVKNPGTENESLVVQGRYSYVGPDGKVYAVSYYADEKGFDP